MDELYAGDPTDFVATRKRLVAQLRKEGAAELAKTVASLRKPAVAAAAVNHLARQEDPPNIPALRELGERMRDAAARMDAAELKELGAERSSLIGELLEEAASFGGGGASARDQLTQTFTAALASAEAEDAVCSGNLVNPLSYSGFGEVAVAEAVALPLRELQEARLAQIAQRDAERAAKPTRSSREESAGRATPGPAPEPASEPEPVPPSEPEPVEAEPVEAEPAAEPAPTASVDSAVDSAIDTAIDTAGARRVYEQCLALEQQAQAAVEAARAALAAAKEHAAAAGRARQAAEDLLDSLD